MSDTQKTRKASVDALTIVLANNRIAAEGGTIDDLAAELDMNVDSLRPRRTKIKAEMLARGVKFEQLKSKPRGNRKVDFDAIADAVRGAGDGLEIDTDE